MLSMVVLLLKEQWLLAAWHTHTHRALMSESDARNRWVCKMKLSMTTSCLGNAAQHHQHQQVASVCFHYAQFFTHSTANVSNLLWRRAVGTKQDAELAEVCHAGCLELFPGSGHSDLQRLAIQRTGGQEGSKTVLTLSIKLKKTESHRSVSMISTLPFLSWRHSCILIDHSKPIMSISKCSLCS